MNSCPTTALSKCLVGLACCLLLACSGRLAAQTPHYNPEADTSTLISITPKTEITTGEFQDKMRDQGVPLFLTPIRADVRIYEVRYYTTHPKLGRVPASGLLFVPRGLSAERYPVVGYHHGTQIRKQRGHVPSGEDYLAAAMCADGYVVVKPDYVGLGHSPGLHPYHHWVSEALSTVDFLRALKTLEQRLELPLNWDLLFLSGYSQGGHATLATHRYIQDSVPNEFTVRASSPMSGAYDLTGVQGDVMFQPYSHPGYLPYLFFGFNQFLDHFDNPGQVFKEPYASKLPELFDGQHSMGEVNDILPAVPADMIRDSTLERYNADPNHPVKVAFLESSVHDWKPQAPVQLCYCKRDEQVSWKNAIVAHKAMKARGARNVTKRMSGRKFGHNPCAVYAGVYTKYYFDSFRKGSKKGRKGPVFKRWVIGIGKIFEKGAPR